MSAKVKLISFISAFVLVLGIMIIGVLSAEQVQVNIGGSVSFNATNVYARVSGNISGAQTGNKTFSTLTYSAEETTGDESDWTNLALEFTETPDPIIITITVENISTERQLMVSLEDNIVSNGLNKSFTKDNEAYVTGDTDLLPASTSESISTTTFVITLSVAQPDLSLENVDFGFILNLYDETAIPVINDFEFDLDEENGIATVTNYLGSGGAVTIPSSISTRIAEDGTTEYIMGSDYRVTAIAAGSSSSGPFYSAQSTLTSITIPGAIETIGNYAFYNCTALTEINYNATNVSDLSSGNRVFYNAGQDGTGITVNIGPNVTRLPNYIFCPVNNNSYSPNITTVNFAEGSVCESIGTYAFYSCHILTSITIPQGVTSIGDWAFTSCRSLTSITIPDSVTSINNYAFGYCYALAEVYNYSSITITAGSSSNGCLGEYAKVVYNASQLMGDKPATRITVVDNMQYYNYGSDFIALAPTSRNVTEVILDNRTTEINQSAFMDCSSLSSITLPNNLTSIGYEAFSRCSSLTSITIPERVTEISSDAFYGCSSLTSITIPASVTSITSAFRDCSSLTSIEVDPANTTYSSEEGVLFNKDKTTLVTYPEGKSETYTIPASVTSIGTRAFSDCNSLTSIIIPDSVTSIGGYAFNYCSSLTSITIPSSVTSIGNWAFQSCNFSTVTIDSSYAYQNAGGSYNTCGHLLEDANTVYVNANLVGSYTASSYLTSNFTCSDAPNEAGYYVYTRN